ncbi:transcriptional regulator [Longilinea arvoryzae]|uniref:Transcriptional regulator n=1 Tax=Longilinea arvoryzae TaxID=360412 RepID=A0A0S7BDY4_9CHLR|nr:TetR/AcrR family transcriptional regulator [Longilinea arvoryzae]GAP13693.1 transcriptional regulator [Longilinea arvoryzae]
MCAVTRRDPQLRLEIVNAARLLITEKGVDSTSLADIARTVGISKGTLFYYYATKADLIFDVTDQYFDQTTRTLNAWVDEVHDALTANEIFSHVFHTIIEDELRSKLHHYLIEQALTENGNLKDRFLEKYQEWTEVIRTGLSRVFPANGDQEVLAMIVISCLDGLILQAVLGNKSIPIEAIVTHLSTSAAEK